LTNDNIQLEYDAQMALSILQVMDTEGKNHLSLWTSHGFVKRVIHYQLATCRQLVAESMFRSGKVMEALRYLEDAVNAAPHDAGVAFSLGSLQLYLCFFGIDDAITPESKKKAQVQLMIAAKLDSTLASPFALLGYWYESTNDMKRAIGCYSKALALDPTHPIAGRGILRLAPSTAVRSILEQSINLTSALNGWAWRAIGLQKCVVDGDDEIGLVALQKALRCQDIQHIFFDFLSAFYSSPMNPQLPSRKEVINILTEIACCYRRLGRFTAAIRSFHNAIDESCDEPSSFLLCQCAQGK
jgi:tetratricopeptide (TPR) repeat protein